MHSRNRYVKAGVLAAPALVLLGFGWSVGRADEPGRLGRFLRFGGSTSTAAPERDEAASEPRPRVVNESPATSSALSRPAAAGASPRIVPQPRQTRAITSADPLVTRVALGRSDEGSQFGMFLQVYADGTVIDSEGVHSLGREAIRGVLAALESTELYRLRGHCGAPSTDFIEAVQLVVFERNLGRLRANAFSFSGNPQGCDPSVARLHAALDALQNKMARPASTASPAGSVHLPTTSTSPPPLAAPALRLNGPA